MNNNKNNYKKRLLSIILSAVLLTGLMPVGGITAKAENNGSNDYSLDNGYIKVEVSEDNGAFSIRTIEGDKVNKDDNNKDLLFPDDYENTSFTSFQVVRGDIVKEYIFGGKYNGSSDVTVTKSNNALKAEWSVDGFTFTENISLVNSGAAEHGMVYISYTVRNTGEAASVKARILLDTALGSQDYGYYNIGDGNSLVEQETTLAKGGYSKSFYVYDDPVNPSVTAYTVNASVDNHECEPYQTIFAHWNNLASTVFDYTSDGEMTFTNPYNKKYLTADSAYALYFDMGNVAKSASSVIATNYGVFSNEQVKNNDTIAVNIIAPDVMELTPDKSDYVDNGNFSINTDIENISSITYERVRVVLYTTGGIVPLDDSGTEVQMDYNHPYTKDYENFVPGQTQITEWKFKARPQETGVYANVHYKIYDVSDDATLSTDKLLAQNLIGEGKSYIMCPGTLNSIPKIQFTGSSPDILYNQGTRNLYITGYNFKMLTNKGDYKLLLSRTDGRDINGKDSIILPSENINIDDNKNIITVLMNDENPGTLPEGQYQLIFDYTDSSKQDLSAPALRFTVKEEEKYRNDTYGLLTVEKSSDLKYIVNKFSSDEKYQQALDEGRINRDNVLLEFRGTFLMKQDSQNPDKKIYTGISLSSEDNVMTMNNCLDIENGSTVITEENGSVVVDFDASIYTTGSRTSVWKGVCALTKLEAGEDYGLIPYEENGERASFNYNTITLLWPSVGQAAQNLLGFLMDFKYGELGVIKHENADETRVVAFGAAMDLSFLVPKASQSEGEASALDAAHEDMVKNNDVSGDSLRDVNDSIPYNSDTVNTNAGTMVETGTDTGDSASGGDGDSRSACIQIDDILFGGKYLGVNMTVALGIPGYVEGMPSMEAILTVKTVGDWEVGASGVCDFSTFFLEGEIYIKSYNNIPVPDKLRFYMGGVTPGINVDGMGILWLQGAGGGIDNLYDTIFMTDAIPPLQLIIEAQFSIMQIISARASLALSLRGIGVELSDGKLANALPVLNQASLEFDWYPEFYFLSSVDMSILDAINGSGYIVAEDNGFFEFFIRAALQIPNSVPVVGGKTVAQASLGANFEKIWGQVNVLCVDVGLVYYWGGNIDWSGGSKATPTYPELAGMSTKSMAKLYEGEAVPVYYDKANNKTLYVQVGTNIIKNTDTKLEGSGVSLTSPDRLRNTNELTTKIDGKTHILSLVPKTNSEMLIVEWTADSEEEAVQCVRNGGIKITDNDDENSEYILKLLDHNALADSQSDENANLTYDADTKKATLAVTFTEDEYFNRTWKISTEEVSSVVLYDVEELPKITDSELTQNDVDNTMTVTVKGSQLDKFDYINFVAIPHKSSVDGRRINRNLPAKSNEADNSSLIEEKDEAILLYRLENQDGFTDGQQITFNMPADLSSGNYSLRIMASDKDSIYQSTADNSFMYVNAEQPDIPTEVNTSSSGDYKLNLDIHSADPSIDGYRINVYDSEGNPVECVSGLMYMADGSTVRYNDDGSILKNIVSSDKATISVGGQYEFTDIVTDEDIASDKYNDEDIMTDEKGNKLVRIVKGLKAGQNYTVGVSSWKIASDGKTILYSKELKGNEVEVNEPVKTEFTFSTNAEAVELTETRQTSKDGTIEFKTPTYKTNDLTLTIGATTNVVGEWTLDGGNADGYKGTVVNEVKEFDISLSGLAEGVHTLEFIGKNENGDSVGETFTFGIDTMGPRLMLASPVNGSLFDRNTGLIEIKGITDENTVMTVKNLTTGDVYVNAQDVIVDSAGRFLQAINVDKSMAVQTVKITLQDKAGNITEKEIDIVNDAMGSIESVEIWSGKTNVTNTKISSGNDYELSLYGRLNDGSVIEINNPTLVEWTQNSVEGDASIDDNETGASLILPEGTEGMVTARFLVSDYGVNAAQVAFGETGEPVNPLEGISISGVMGENDWYTSDVDIIPDEGYEVSDVSPTEGFTSEGITISKEGKNEIYYYVRRKGDNAVSQQQKISVKIDKTVPTGNVHIKDKAWNDFAGLSLFKPYRLTDTRFIIQGSDEMSGIADISYMISRDISYESVEALLSSEPEWKKYDSQNPPEFIENIKQIIYVRITDNAGNVVYISSEGIVPDNEAPTVSDVKINNDESLTDKQADITFKISEAGTYYYAVLPDNATVPTIEQLKAQNITGAVMGSDDISDEGGKQVKLTVTGLIPDTSYILYVASEDMAADIKTGIRNGNVSEVSYSEAVRTKKTVVEEETTEEESTTEETTSDESTKEETTSDESTKEETTSDESTTEEITSEESTTEEITSEESTTEETTSDESTTEEITSDESTKEETTSDESTKEEITKKQNSSTNNNITSKEDTTDTSKTVSTGDDMGMVIYICLCIGIMCIIIVVSGKIVSVKDR